MKITLDVTGASLKRAQWIGAGQWEAEGEFSISGKKIFIGLGKKDKWSLKKIRQAVAKILSQAKTFKIRTLALDLASFGSKFSLEEIVFALTEGLRLSGYRFDRYKSKPAPPSTVSEVFLAVPPARRKNVTPLRQSVRWAENISRGVAWARDLANEPANVMTPPQVARAAKEMAKKGGLDCRVLGETEIRKLKMGGILAVSQGSSFPPQFIILENKAEGVPIVLVGKGITFDTGGISLKPSADMDKMKFDMCGAAAVLGAMKIAADLKLPVRVVGIAPVCENMPGSTAQRPGDIIRCHNGKTVEVLNTDAEGRLILADALSYAQKLKPRAVVDMATLTGACAATFGEHAIGLMSTDEELAGRIRKAGETTGERCWELPLWDEYFDLIKATNADIQNISKKNAGTITAAMFLKEFTDPKTPWAHLDIAGTAWTNVGATGVGVRLFVELIKSYINEK